MRATYTQIRAFNAVAREGGFLRAAERLHLTQPAITLQVRGLEDNFGAVLFHRRGQTVTLTETGRTLYALTQQIKTIEEQVDELLSDQFQLLTGELLISSGSPPALMGLVREFTLQYPNINVSIKIGNWTQVWNSIIDRTADVALLTAPPKDDRIEQLPYLEQRVIAVVTANHPLAKKSSVSLDELVKENLVVRDDNSHTQKLVEDMFHDAGIPLNPVLTLDNREGVHEAAAAGLGIGFVLNNEICKEDRVRTLNINDYNKTCMEAVICLKTQFRRRVVRAFFRVAEEIHQSKI